MTGRDGGPPTSNTGVGFVSDGGQGSGPYGWDWSATTHDLDAAPENVVEEMLGRMGAELALPGKGLQGWPMSVKAFDGDGFALGSVYFGGGRDDLHVLATSEAADKVRPLVADHAGARTARVDTRVDTLTPFDELVGVLREASMVYRSRLYLIESEEGGESLGRTVYLGAPSSAVRVRAYQKWLESPGQYVEGTNRVEVQLRPPSKVKGRVSGWTPAETFCASKTTRALAERLGKDLTPKASLHIQRGTPELERTLEVMGHQYGPAFRKWMELSGGDLGKVLDYLTDEGPATV